MHRWCRSALRRMLGCAVVAAAADFAASGENAPLPPIHVLIISGQNNHAWEPTLARMRETCERTGRFRLTVNTSPQTMGPDDLRRVRVVLSHWNAWGDAPVRQWSPEARSGLLDFVQRGGGHVAVHAGSSSFYDWPEYHAMAGAAWALGRTGHGPVQAFRVTVAAPDHPITRGIVGFWTVDELWHRTGITPGVTVLATGFSDALRGGTGNEEPVAVCGAYGQGRTMALLLGHDARAMANAGFESLLTRGLEWAAGGEVSLPPSPELPASAAAARLASADLKGLLEAVAGYRFGMDRGDLLELEVLAADAGTGSESRGAFARTVAEALPKAASAEARIGLCRVLSLVGTAAEISVLETMLGDPDLHLAACEALQRIPGPEATAALVRALSRGDATDAMVAAHALAARRDP
ncbi:MAG: ThuA domain-containing protein, partial [Lentisphaeria bacterium]|nr:ThuA domain-containing protein [Lentisphaeria bacterium]